MELVLIAFLGTLVLSVVELRDFVRHLHGESVAPPAFPAVSDPPGRTVVHQPATTVAESYSEAA
jgi:hypothetical protein